VPVCRGGVGHEFFSGFKFISIIPPETLFAVIRNNVGSAQRDDVQKSFDFALNCIGEIWSDYIQFLQSLEFAMNQDKDSGEIWSDHIQFR
jgi:hypothetical protein